MRQRLALRPGLARLRPRRCGRLRTRCCGRRRGLLRLRPRPRGRLRTRCCGWLRSHRLAPARARLRAPAGQSTVEVVALLPLALAVGLAVFGLLSAGRAEEAAGSAAEAGAAAMLQGREPRAAARAALAGWPERRTEVRVAGRRVTVRVTPPGPLGARLRATVTASAGPAQ